MPDSTPVSTIVAVRAPGFTRRRNGVSFPERPPACQCLFPRRGRWWASTVASRETSCLLSRQVPPPHGTTRRRTANSATRSPRAVSKPCRTTAVYQRTHPPGSRSQRQLVDHQGDSVKQEDDWTVGGIAVTTGAPASVSTRASPVAPSRCRRQAGDMSVADPTPCVRRGGASRDQHRDHHHPTRLVRPSRQIRRCTACRIERTRQSVVAGTSRSNMAAAATRLPAAHPADAYAVRYSRSTAAARPAPHWTSAAARGLR